MDWPIYYKDLLRIGNLKSQVGIATCWTICDEIIKDIDKNLYCVAGQLYTKSGINYLVRNLLANKNIRYLILCGQDRSKSGKEVIALWEKGDIKLLEKEIDRTSVKKMIKNVKLINLQEVKDPKKITEEIKKLDQSLDPYGKNETFPEPKKEEISEMDCRFPSDPSVFKVRGKTVADTWLKVLKTIMRFGDIKETDSMKMKEIYNLAAIVTDEDPDNPEIPEFLGFNKKKIEEYIPQIVSGEKIKGLHYTYGFRLKTHFEIDQIEHIIKKLKNDENAREAVGVLFDPKIDIEAEHRPCIVLIQALRNQNKLNLNVYVRSNDMFGGWPLNVFGLRKLHKEISNKANLPMGDLTTISASAHIYDFNFKEALKIIENNYDPAFEEDPRGYFKISIGKNEIIAEHCNPEGNVLKTYTQKMDVQKPAMELSRKINKDLAVSLTSHAFDLGIELYKAETCLKLGINYTQDAVLPISEGKIKK